MGNRARSPHRDGLEPIIARIYTILAPAPGAAVRTAGRGYRSGLPSLRRRRSPSAIVYAEATAVSTQLAKNSGHLCPSAA